MSPTSQALWSCELKRNAHLASRSRGQLPPSLRPAPPPPKPPSPAEPPPAPEWRVSLPWTLNKRAAIEAIPERLRPDAFERQREVEAQLAAAAKENGATFVSALEALCTLEDGCLVRLSEEPLMLTTWDYGHLTTPAAKLVARRVALSW